MKAKQNTVSISDKRMLSMKEACQYLGLGRTCCRSYCEKIGAVHHFGSRILFDRFKIDAAISAEDEE